MPKPDYSTWVRKEQAAEILGVSTKTVEQLAQKKLLEMAYWRRPETGAKVSVYRPADVEEQRRQRNPEALNGHVMPAESGAKTMARAPVSVSVESALMRLLQAAGSDSQNSRKYSEVRLAERLFHTVPEASDYSGLPQAHLLRLVKAGKLPALKTGSGWRIARVHLEQFAKVQ